MKTLPANLILEKNKISTSSAWLLFLELTLTDNEKFYFVKNFEDITIEEAGAFEASPVSDGCVGYFRFDEVSGSIASDRAGVQDGSLYGAFEDPDSWVTGKRGNALDWSQGGTSVNVSYTSEYDFSATDFSFSAWVKTPKPSAGNTIELFSAMSSTKGYFLAVDEYGHASLTLRDSFVHTQTINFTATDIADSGWHHIVVAINRTTDIVHTYIDNVAGNTGDISSIGTITDASNMHIGCSSYLGNKWLGLIDEFFVYNKCVSVAEVAALWDSGDGVSFSTAYTAFPFEIEPTKQTGKGEIPSTTLRVDNTTRMLQSYLRAADGGVGASVKIMVKNSALLAEDHSELEMLFDVLSVTSNSKTVDFILGAPNPLQSPCPLYQYFAEHCRWSIFKGPECGYSGGDTTCDRILSDCRAKGNAARFGGFPGLRSGTVRFA